ncbi:hypothetical protein V8G54_023059 [Vigna mungo]|uniref:Uncharacterized protein n=1 Tax=Vigna mungo TaxID=3915 RepID=A0AAQ3RR71_VIGMU
MSFGDGTLVGYWPVELFQHLNYPLNDRVGIDKLKGCDKGNSYEFELHKDMLELMKDGFIHDHSCIEKKKSLLLPRLNYKPRNKLHSTALDVVERDNVKGDSGKMRGDNGSIITRGANNSARGDDNNDNLRGNEGSGSTSGNNKSGSTRGDDNNNNDNNDNARGDDGNDSARDTCALGCKGGRSRMKMKVDNTSHWTWTQRRGDLSTRKQRHMTHNIDMSSLGLDMRKNGERKKFLMVEENEEGNVKERFMFLEWFERQGLSIFVHIKGYWYPDLVKEASSHLPSVETNALLNKRRFYREQLRFPESNKQKCFWNSSNVFDRDSVMSLRLVKTINGWSFMGEDNFGYTAEQIRILHDKFVKFAREHGSTQQQEEECSSDEDTMESFRLSIGMLGNLVVILILISVKSSKNSSRRPRRSFFDSCLKIKDVSHYENFEDCSKLTKTIGEDISCCCSLDVKPCCKNLDYYNAFASRYRKDIGCRRLAEPV